MTIVLEGSHASLAMSLAQNGMWRNLGRLLTGHNNEFHIAQLYAQATQKMLGGQQAATMYYDHESFCLVNEDPWIRIDGKFQYLKIEFRMEV